VARRSAHFGVWDPNPDNFPAAAAKRELNVYDLGKLIRKTPWWAWVVGVVIVDVVAIAALGDYGKSTTSTESVTGSVLTGIGATDADWEKNHEPNPRFAPGSAYSLDAPGGDRAFSTRYYLVEHSGGRVQSYDMRFAPGTSLGEAIEETLAEFPADAHWDSFGAVPASGSAGACAQGKVSSTTLTSELNQGPTAGLVEFYPRDRPVASCLYLDDAVSRASVTLAPPTSP
jgi:hypothetical protein